MEIVKSELIRSRLCICCSGVFGIGSNGNPSGCKIQNAIERFINEQPCPVSDIAIDFTKVEYEWGDGPAWAIMSALQQGLKVKYITNVSNHEAISNLIEVSGLNAIRKIEIERNLDI